MGLATDIVITGAGVVSPIGIGKSTFWDSLQQGRSGVHTLDWLEDTQWPVRFGGQVTDFEPKKYVKPRKSLKVMCREIQFGFSAATLAMEDGNLEAESVDCDRFGVICGSEMFYGDPNDLIQSLHNCKDENGEYDEDLWGDHALQHIYPLWMLMYLPNMVACHIAIAQDARGPNNTICQGEASGLLALIEAASVIERGLADVMIVGGSGSRLSVAAMMYRGDANLSHRNDAPESAARPFEASRDGMVNGEGAAAIVLESRAHAEARGATPIAKLLGSHRSFGAPSQREKGLRHAINGALQDTDTTSAQLAHVNVEGLSTVDQDVWEAGALSDCLGDTPVFAPKSYFGNLGGGTGVVELVASLTAIENQLTPKTLNYEQPDPKCPVAVTSEPLAMEAPRVMCVNQSTTGQSVAVVLERP